MKNLANAYNLINDNIGKRHICFIGHSNVLSSWLVYQSKKYPGLATAETDLRYSSYSKSDDLKYGNKTLTQINQVKNITEKTKQYCKDKNNEALMKEFKTLLTRLSTFKLQDVALEMLDHFEQGTGSDFKNNDLTYAVFAHKSTIDCIANAKKRISKYIEDKKGDISDIGNGMYDMFNDEVFSRPNYSGILDKVNGLSILVHDTWGMNIYLRDFSYNKSTKKYRGKLDITFYDHFGLDDNDMNLSKEAEKQGDNFRAWYCLQKYDGFGEAYKPFIVNFSNEMDIEN